MSNRSTKTYRTETSDTTASTPAPWEPRVARVEVGLDSLKDTVNDLAAVVRSQGTQTEKQLQELMIAVTQAAGPRKTDWSLIVSFIFLVMAIGSAVFWPLNQTSQNNKSEIQTITQEIKEHNQLQLHPVGQALLGRLEDRLASHIEDNNRQMKEHGEADGREFQAIENKLTKEIATLQERNNARLNKLEALEVNRTDEELQELRAWRNKASGLASPDKTTVLQSKDASVSAK